MVLNAALLKSERTDWNTPRLVVELVSKFGGGFIGLDPCWNEQSLTMPIYKYALPTNGLECSWKNDGLVYVNPPYGREIGHWTEKACRQAEYGAEIVALVPARTDTKWFQRDCFEGANAICFWRGRLTFRGAPAPAPFPSALVYWGDRIEQFYELFYPHGFVMALRR